MQSTDTLSPEVYKVFETLPDLYLILSPDLMILAASNAYLEATLTERKQLEGRPVFEVFPDPPGGTGMASVKASLQQVLDTRQPHQMELIRYDRPHPSRVDELVERHWQTSHTPVLNEKGNVQYIIHRTEDVTRQVETEALLQALLEQGEQVEAGRQEVHKLNEELVASRKERKVTSEELVETKETLKQLHNEFEERVASRTHESELALTEENFQRSRLRAVFEQAPVAICVLRGSTYLLDVVNLPMAEMMGRPLTQLIGKPLPEAMPELVDQGFLELLDGVRSTGIPYVAEERMVRLQHHGAQGTGGYYNFVYQPLREERDQITGIICVAAEVTQQVEARRKMEESENRFRSLLESIPQMTWTNLPTGEVNFCNQRWRNYTGLSFEQTKDWGWQAVVHPEDLPSMMEAYLHALQTGEVFVFETRYKRGSDEMYRWYLNRAIPMRNEKDEITLWVGTATDIHEQKLVEQHLVESEQYFRSMADSVPVMIWVTRPDGYCTYLNKQWYDYTGQTREEAQGLGWARATHPEDTEAAGKIFMEASTNQTVFRLTYRLRGKDGTYRWFTDVGLPKFSPTGEFEGHVGTVLDIHEQKLAEQSLYQMSQELAASNEELAAANEEIQSNNEELALTNERLLHINADLDNFIYTASHDLKAPIANIEGLLRMLVRQLPPSSVAEAKVGKTINYIQESVERFKRTIASLTEVVKLQKENSQQASRVNLDQLIEEVQKDLAPQIKEAAATVVVDVLPCPAVDFSEKNLRSILYNLLSNAIKYRSPDRHSFVRIDCRETDQYQLLTVADNGLGMDLSGKQKLFSMFGRLHDHVEGSGIGLYMVRRIIENAGGKIEVESQVGVGSTFRIYFKRQHPSAPLLP